MDNIGEKIRIRRVTKSYSQEYMAFMLNISQAAYSNLERGETALTLTRVYEIAEILEMSPFELMPKPKFGLGINHVAFIKTIKKLQATLTAHVKARKKLTFPSR
ncbi:helix-turn-helix domain-containing protein [Mucilaginibacter sp. UYCu711]|uniref:helix-turn-helix domain-containing protein n=1 Tax=Mucilaginibacter sp. UYCu711 TaxID=3156339 RepID=UPI003D1C3AA1